MCFFNPNFPTTTTSTTTATNTNNSSSRRASAVTGVESVVEGGGSFVTLTASESVETSSEQPPLSQPVQLAGRNWRSLAVLLLGNQNTEIVTIFFGGTSVAVLVDPDPN